MTGKSHVLVNIYAAEVAEGYESLFRIFQMAMDQAQFGKGRKRHAEDGKPFETQDICREAQDLGLAAPIYQARKKAKEALRLDPEKAVEDLLGAINYLAAAVIVIEETKERERKDRCTNLK